MKISAFAGALCVLALTGTTAFAETDYNANVTNGVYYGSGNSNGAFTVETVDGVELGLRAHEYKVLPAPPTGNVYNFDLGDNISFDWSFDPLGTPLTGVSSSIKITNLGTGGTATFAPGPVSAYGNGSGGYQDSWRLEFGFLNDIPYLGVFLAGDIDYDAGKDSTYRVTWSFDSNETAAFNNTIIINQGAGVPEPGVWALMILGFGGAGAVLRRRRSALA